MLKAEINNISIRDDGNKRVLLENLFFQLEKNSINIIVGKNGTGKSTMIRSMTRLLDERFYTITGKVLFNDIDLMGLSYDELLKIRQSRIRYVFQDAINSFDPLRNIGYSFRGFENNPDMKILFEKLMLPDMKGLFRLYPYEISGGMAQRLLLASSLIAQPELLILDEPTSGIDTPISNLILFLMKEFILKNDNSILLVTQDLQFAEKAGNKIAFLENRTLSPFYSVDEFFGKSDAGLEKFISAYNQLK
jgi:ABC-type dipeptide/oligopeptide/nickel transport system ATPase component